MKFIAWCYLTPIIFKFWTSFKMIPPSAAMCWLQQCSFVTAFTAFVRSITHSSAENVIVVISSFFYFFPMGVWLVSVLPLPLSMSFQCFIYVDLFYLYYLQNIFSSFLFSLLCLLEVHRLLHSTNASFSDTNIFNTFPPSLSFHSTSFLVFLSSLSSHHVLISIYIAADLLMGSTISDLISSKIRGTSDR